MNEPEVFALSAGDRQTGLWQRLLEHLTNRLAIARAKNDGQHDAVVTATLRGQIGVYKTLLALDQDLPDITE